ncbi:hypothetical protein PanWU01x14_063320 [Parasponia andersonii]|uniref:DUF7731 domain-containing protein n=1 Tax=Parasponia andersonii TaxID=3476 RepID=A0A2P5DHY0_PARAD|nr:hypothetical protein PanWU01x14_063320 [Parasponia andersonii]
MENFKLFGGKLGSFCLSLVIALLLRYANAENTTEPTTNVNFSENQKWRSVYFCLKNKAPNGPCQPKDVLTPVGNLSVSRLELDEYCKPGNCADHIRNNVLKCIFLVMRSHDEIVFRNNATLRVVNDTITHGCATKFSDIYLGNSSHSGGIKVYQKTYLSLGSGLLVFLAIFNNL